jgi:hypothetical protein
MQQELKRKGMTKLLLWEEYCAEDSASAYGYTQFCEHYQRWLKKLSIGTLIDPPICGVLDPLKTVFFVLKQSDYFLLCAPRPV